MSLEDDLFTSIEDEEVVNAAQITTLIHKEATIRTLIAEFKSLLDNKTLSEYIAMTDVFYRALRDINMNAEHQNINGNTIIDYVLSGRNLITDVMYRVQAGSELSASCEMIIMLEEWRAKRA